MKLIYEAPKGGRVHHDFDHVYIRYSHLTELQDKMIFVHSLREWVPIMEFLKNPENRDLQWSFTAPCKTLRAFKRMLRKNPQIHGMDVVLFSGYDGYNIKIQNNTTIC